MFSSLAANWSRTGWCLQHEKGASLVHWYEDTKSFTSCKIWPKTSIFGQISVFLAHLHPCQPKNNADKLPRWFFRYVGTITYTYSRKKLDFWSKHSQIWPKINFFGQISAFDPFGPRADQKFMWTRYYPGGFSVTWVQKLWLPPERIRILGLNQLEGWFFHPFRGCLNDVITWGGGQGVRPKDDMMTQSKGLMAKYLLFLKF